MSYIVCKNPEVKMDLMVKKKYWPKMIGHIQRTECQYKSEEIIKMKGEEWICVRDIYSKHGYEIGALIGLFYGLEWEDIDANKAIDKEKFYILLNKRRKVKNNDTETREKTHQGSKRRTGGKRHFGPRIVENVAPITDRSRDIGFDIPDGESSEEPVIE